MKLSNITINRSTITGKLTGNCTLSGGRPNYAVMARQLTEAEINELAPIIDKLTASFVSESIAAITSSAADAAALEHKGDLNA